jgi:Na+-transporting NADH:ubiquinone oxidoreductase subunit NqrF
MPLIEIVGHASKTSRMIEVDTNDKDENLLHWLRRHGVTMASSCDGEGVCKKCVIQNNLLSCKLSLKTFFELHPDGKIHIGYL